MKVLVAIDKREPYWSSARIASSKSGVDAEIIYAHWAVSSNSFSEKIAVENHNYSRFPAVVGLPSKNGYILFRDSASFGSYFGDYIKAEFDKNTNKRPVTTLDDYLDKVHDMPILGDVLKDPITSESMLNSLDKALAGNINIIPPILTQPSNTSGYTASTDAANNPVASTGGKQGITAFQGFIATTVFRLFLRQEFRKSGMLSLHEFLNNTMGMFYHTLYYIPTLPYCNCIVAKPETLFIDIPSCNVIYPQFISTGSFFRNPKQEPTRLLMETPPLTIIGGDSKKNAFNTLTTLVYLDYEGSGDDRVTKVKGFRALGGNTDVNTPLSLVSTFEEEHGIRQSKTQQGADLYVYLASGQLPGIRPEKEKGKNDDTAGNTQQTFTLGKAYNEYTPTLLRLASYQLQRMRYETRGGTYNLYFNPYIVPGFPTAIITNPAYSDLNVQAYVTDVTHHLYDSGWSTTVSVKAVHTDDDPAPENYPIVDDDYIVNLDSTYKAMLGPTVEPISYDTSTTRLRKVAESQKMDMREGYKDVWRPLTTIEEVLTKLLDNASLSVVGDYKILKIQSNFFRSEVQSKLLVYSEKIVKGEAFSLDDVT